ncbi:MAG TPA: hypothetical protein VG322_16040 [Candidatus Acidoferrales bacterium]|nr:hypothetical protein [Candidatus Acidoferrales bacterium]
MILSDDPEFARPLLARWQSEKSAPEITLATSDTWRPAAASQHDLIIAGALRNDARSLLLSILNAATGKPVIYLTAEVRESHALQTSHPALLVLERREDWAANLSLLGNEILRRVEAVGRAHRAERCVVESQAYAALGRYMLDMRPGVNDALTSILGNADLLLFEPGQAFERTREQIQTIHRMTLRLNEIMQRFSSLATEMQASEFEPELVPASDASAD